VEKMNSLDQSQHEIGQNRQEYGSINSKNYINTLVGDKMASLRSFEIIKFNMLKSYHTQNKNWRMQPIGGVGLVLTKRKFHAINWLICAI
jgi:hypothetical protein